MAREVRVLFLSPYPSVRAGLNAQAAEDPELRVAGQVAGSADLARALAQARPDVVIADPSEADVTPLLELLAERGIALVLLTDNDRARGLAASSDLPGWALLRRDAEAAELSAAIRGAAEGMIVLGRGVLAERLDRLFGPSAEELDPLQSGDELLTAREREVLQLLASGLPNKVIAARLSVSLHTIKFHVASILAKLGASSRTEAVTTGARRGLVTL
jgi:DNA-binding NarL/FixJ family response regulator